ncbi:MAG: hypothetical protein KBD65_02955 [Candidatus Moranbacteria bacterium]|nr:hypothetical protein [Candidatus Moranbacteria bacterium]
MEHIKPVIRKWMRDNTRRDDVIWSLWLNGHTKAEIGRQVGLSRERVRYIISLRSDKLDTK